MAKGKILSLVMVFLVLTILSVMFIANLGDMRGDYGENTTFADTGEKAFSLFDMLSAFIIPLAIIMGVLLVIFAIKWAFSQAGGGVHY